MDATSPYRDAADRARVIAAIARDRFGPPETLRVLGDIARHLSAAADHFAAYTPSATSGLAGHDLPAEAAGELWIAETLAYDHPAARLPMDFTNYVKAPLTGRMPFPDPLNPLSDRFAQQETELRNRLEQLHADTVRASEDVVQWLTEVLTVWRDWMRLAEVVRADNERPTRPR